MYSAMKFLAAGTALGLIAACSQQEEPVVIPQETPIYGKDGTIIGMRPAVSPGGMSSGDGMDMDDSDDDDDEDDG